MPSSIGPGPLRPSPLRRGVCFCSIPSIEDAVQTVLRIPYKIEAFSRATSFFSEGHPYGTVRLSTASCLSPGSVRAAFSQPDADLGSLLETVYERCHHPLLPLSTHRNPMDHCGILYHTHDRANGTFTAAQVPLEEVKVNVWIVDVTARVTIVQRFFNATSTRTGRAKYCFPVPASGAICSFQMSSSDGRIIRGECKEKDMAREQYEAAVASGEMAGLLDYVTDDVFTISIGHVPPHTVLETHMVYAMTLYTGDFMDQVRFQLPYHVGQRYGIPPEGVEFQPDWDKTRVSITIDIQMSGRVQDVLSPSHPDIEETRYSTHLGRPSRRRTTIRYHSNSYLDRDFLVIIRARDLDKPRCFVEIRKDALHRYPDSLALQLTMVPRTKIPPIKSQRYLFVVDRSGSMDGARIETAKRVLITMLRMLPAQGSTFNIFGFGNTCIPWRARSEPYTQYTLEEATSYVEAFQADFGGTEIRGALNKVFASSPADMSTVIFVLTDGEAYDVEGTKLEVSHFVASSHMARRVFTLGIGDSVSTEMCEGIARAGNGECLFAVNTESIIQKCAKLFTAARTPFIRNITIDWGVNHSSSQLGSPEVTFSNQPSPRTVATRPLPPIQQTPHMIEAIHSGTRMNIFAIVTSRHAKPPKEVVLSGILDDETDRPFQFKIVVQQIALVESNNDIPLIHTMAAWKLIQEYSDNRNARVPLPQPIGIIATEEELRQSVIVQLGVQYQIASQHTSFVAVEQPRDGRMGRKLKHGFLHNHPEYVEENIEGSEQSLPDALEVVHHKLHAVWKAMTSALSVLSSLWGNTVTSPLEPTLVQFMADNNSQESLVVPPGSWPQQQNTPDLDLYPSGADDGGFGSQGSGRSSVQTFSTLSSLEGWSGSSSSSWSSTRSDDSGDNSRAPSPTFRQLRVERDQTPQQRDSRMMEPPVPTSIVELVKSQQFDGSYTRTEAIKNLVGDAAVNEAQRLSRPERDVWPTILSVAYLRKQLQNNPELLDNLLSKTLEYLREQDGINIDELLERATRLLR